MRPKKKTTKLIRKIFKWWATYLGVMRYEFDLLYCSSSEWDQGKDCIAYINTDWKYQEASIYFNMQKMRERSAEQIEYTIVHELCHLLVNEMQNYKRVDHEERVVTDLAKAFIWVRDQAKEEALKGTLDGD